ncbi:LapA family protein [Streptomyces beihaiensis]|uniref:LapA family protein n=1 Tax=Streptomyces beihaiensis TaxID=2984495 RepID=A0ABT3TS56_9ACTN|nr:LapA family protein [Streptomyces beihaiensis]MCX3059610.1 LapA family protein [Streptomyces beihaiensis]
MHEPLTGDYLKRTQQVILGLPNGPWKVEPSEHGEPDRVGPISFLETWSDDERLPVIEFIAFAREALPAYLGEVARQRDRIRALERRVRQLEQERVRIGHSRPAVGNEQQGHHA